MAITDKVIKEEFYNAFKDRKYESIKFLIGCNVIDKASLYEHALDMLCKDEIIEENEGEGEWENIQEDSLENLKFLLKNGAKLKIKNFKDACYYGSTSIVRYLCEIINFEHIPLCIDIVQKKFKYFEQYELKQEGRRGHYLGMLDKNALLETFLEIDLEKQEIISELENRLKDYIKER